jgi:hypothetical protein
MTKATNPPTDATAGLRSSPAYGSALRTGIVRVMLILVFVPIVVWSMGRETCRCLSNLKGFWSACWSTNCREFRMCWRAEFKPIDPMARCQREPNG